MTPIAAISQKIWEMKYRFKNADGVAIDKTIDDTFRRVSSALAQAENAPQAYTEEFFHALRDFKFLPAGRIMAGAGTKRDVTLFNCFVMGDIPDDMSGIFESLREAALTMQQGGGTSAMISQRFARKGLQSKALAQMLLDRSLSWMFGMPCAVPS